MHQHWSTNFRDTSPQLNQAPKTKLLEFTAVEPAEGVLRAEAFCTNMAARRSVREFSDRAVPRAIIEAAIRTAGTAPSGANLQPWHFVAVGKADVQLRQRLRRAAEEEEREFYSKRATPQWLAALAPLGTDSEKPFLEIAPWLIAVFMQPHGVGADGSVLKHYYASESVGIATGFLIAGLHQAGLAVLTHTPSPMGFLNELLGRPAHERAFVLLVAGYPAPTARVPDIARKALGEIGSFR